MSAAPPSIEALDLDAEALENPYPTYARLRATQGFVRHAREGYLLVARYDEVREAAMRSEDFSSRIVEVLVHSMRLGPLFEAGMARLGPVDVLAVVDAPSHLLHRKLATRHFGRDPVAAAVAQVRPSIDARLDAFVAAGGGDFLVALAEHLPAEIAVTLLGFPLGDAPLVKSLTDRAVSLLSGTLPASDHLRTFAGGLGLFAYSLARLAWARRAGGTGTPLGDAIVEATDRGELGVREAASIVMQILIAGSDSTTSLLGASTRMLAEDAALADRLRADPALVPALVEEALRLESPFQGHFRVVRRDTELGGTRLRAGDRLMLLWASANRDPAAFADADAIRLERRRGDKPHLAFGQGSHLCLGAGLARAVSRTVLESLLARTSRIELAPGVLRHRPSGFSRTLAGLPLRVRP